MFKLSIFNTLFMKELLTANKCIPITDKIPNNIFLFFITQKVLIIRWFMVVFLLNGTKKLTFFNNGFIRMNMILSFLSSHYLNNYKNQNNGRVQLLQAVPRPAISCLYSRRMTRPLARRVTA